MVISRTGRLARSRSASRLPNQPATKVTTAIVATTASQMRKYKRWKRGVFMSTAILKV